MNRLFRAAMARYATRTRTDEAGQGLAEYGLVLALVALACVGALTALGVGISESAGFVALPSSL